MFVLRLNTTSKINEDGSKILLTDSTGNVGDVTYVEDVNNEGVYTSVTNSTGYGAPNPTRDTLAFFVVAYLETTNGRKQVSVDVASHTAATWSLSASKDGVYSFYLIGVPIVADPTTLAIGKYGFHVATNEIKFNDGTAIVTVAPSTLIEGTHSSALTQQLHLIKSGGLFTELVSKRVELFIEGICSERDLNLATKSINDVKGLIYSATYEFKKKNILAASRITELLNDKDYSLIFKL